MDLQARKRHFVQEFLRLNNEDILSRFEQMLHAEKVRLYAEAVSPMSLVAFNQLIDAAEDDAANGRVKGIEELDKDMDAWI